MSEVGSEQLTIWRPNQKPSGEPGPQHFFLASQEREVLFGGSAGGGKSDALLMSAAMEHKFKAHRAIIFRKTYPELKDLIRRSAELYPYLGGRYRSSTREWIFSSGAIIEFGYLEKKKDLPKWKRAWNFIGWDELTHWASPDFYVYLAGRLRAVANSGVTLRIRATTNPGGVGHDWVKSRWKIPDEGSASVAYDPDTFTWREFIPARISDNPYLAGTSYETDLNALPEDTRKALRDGRWDIVEGAMYSEFDHRRHTCDAFALNYGVPIWRGADDGFGAPAVILWFARQDGHVYVVAELYRAGMTAQVEAEEVLKRDRLIPLFNGEENLTNADSLDGIIDGSAFNEHGVESHLGTGRGQVMNRLGCRWQSAVKGPGSRVAGVNLIHSGLQNIMPDGLPQLRIFKNCRNLIRILPTIPKDKTNVEDVDTDFTDDHPHDALRYGLQYRKAAIQMRKLKGA